MTAMARWSLAVAAAPVSDFALVSGTRDMQPSDSLSSHYFLDVDGVASTDLNFYYEGKLDELVRD